MIETLSKDHDPCYLGIDIGGTWIKAACKIGIGNTRTDISGNPQNFVTVKIKNPLTKRSTETEIIELIQELTQKLGISKRNIKGIGISTTGIVSYNGMEVIGIDPNLSALKKANWKRDLEEKFHCRITLVNDSEAAMIGLAELGKLQGNMIVGVMPIGTGVGFSIWRNGRRWRPMKRYPLIGGIATPNGNYDQIGSAALLAKQTVEANLTQVFKDPEYQEICHTYLKNLKDIINTVSLLYKLDTVIVCGGLVDASEACNYPLEEALKGIAPEETGTSIEVASEGNKLQLIGAMALAENESQVYGLLEKVHYKKISTEEPYDDSLKLEQLDSFTLAKLFWKVESEAHRQMAYSLPVIAEVIDRSTHNLQRGGRIIYIGAGTSGRIAAMDAVEIPCTYGFPEDRILSLISGGLEDAAIEIESAFEEDASATPEMLLLSITSNDVVIGISASGSSEYVRTGLAFAKWHGALTIMVQESAGNSSTIYDYIIPLNSGRELVAGSTRMKAGTATKKILNTISSAIMIRLGKVRGSYMIDLACYNNKLVDRAKSILYLLYGVDEQEAAQRLQQAGMNLRKVIDMLEKRQ